MEQVGHFVSYFVDEKKKKRLREVSGLLKVTQLAHGRELNADLQIPRILPSSAATLPLSFHPLSPLPSFLPYFPLYTFWKNNMYTGKYSI